MKIGFENKTSRGYTLVELMIVVVIVGVMATIAVYGISKYIRAAKGSEAIEMINSIKAAQEAYKDETFTYFDVSERNLGSYYPVNPAGTAGTKKHSWVNTSHSQHGRWSQLGVSASSAVQFGYATVAGGANAAVPVIGNLDDPPTFPTPTGPWYVVKAVSDFNGDGTLGVFVSTSFTNQIYIEREGE